MDLLIGTSNPGKLREYGEMLASLPIRVLSLRDVGLGSLDIEEPYETFAENATHKARFYARAAGLTTLADDSGLMVDALGGRPGVFSARYGGPTDRDRYMKLLGELGDAPREQRAARFMCVVCAAKADGETISAQGAVEGRIAFEPGDERGGFGYDAVFIPQGYEMVFSAIPSEEKHRLSHRGIALRNLMPALEKWLEK